MPKNSLDVAEVKETIATLESAQAALIAVQWSCVTDNGTTSFNSCPACGKDGWKEDGSDHKSECSVGKALKNVCVQLVKLRSCL